MMEEGSSRRTFDWGWKTNGLMIALAFIPAVALIALGPKNLNGAAMGGELHPPTAHDIAFNAAVALTPFYCLVWGGVVAALNGKSSWLACLIGSLGFGAGVFVVNLTVAFAGCVCRYS